MHFDPNLKTGHAEIDNHHKELFQLTSMLDAAVHENNMDHINDIIRFLEDYVVEHFQEEEEIMEKHNYARYATHKAEHERFKRLTADLRKYYEEKQFRTHLIFKIRQFIDELVGHIRTHDQGIADIVREENT